VIIFLHGADSCRSRQKLSEIISHYKNSRKSGLNLISFDAHAADFSDFYNHFKVSSMFAEKKLVIVKNVFVNKKFQEDFLEKVSAFEQMGDVVVVYEGQEVDQRLKLFKTLAKECKTQEFSLLDTKQTKIWARTEFDRLGVKANLDAVDTLVGYVGNDLWRMSSEIKKLADYKNNGLVRKEDVEKLVAPRIENEIFKTIDALASKNKKQAMELMQRHLDGGDEPLYLLSMLAYQFRTMLVIKELAEKGFMYNSIVQKSGFHPFVVKKNYFACRQFSLIELKNIYRKIFRIDADIKTGKIDSEVALTTFISSI